MKLIIDLFSYLLSIFLIRVKNNYSNSYVYFLFWGLGDAVIISGFLENLIKSQPLKKHIAIVSKNSKSFIEQELNFDEVIEIEPPWTKKTDKYRFLKSNYLTFIKKFLSKNLYIQKKYFPSETTQEMLC